jgi:hypothetical protein
MCLAIRQAGFNFIVVCLPESHQLLYEWIDFLSLSGGLKSHVNRRWTGKEHQTDTYRFVNEVPIRDGEQALRVNWCEITTTNADGKIIYKNAFATNHLITETNVVKVVSSGRARWKTENENHNLLKTKGYHIEHNFGHGKKYLASIFLTLNILSFLFHSVLGLFDHYYLLVRQALGTRKTFFDDVRALTRYTCFSSWDALLDFMARGLVDNLDKPIPRQTSPP